MVKHLGQIDTCQVLTAEQGMCLQPGELPHGVSSHLCERWHFTGGWADFSPCCFELFQEEKVSLHEKTCLIFTM